MRQFEKKNPPHLKLFKVDDKKFKLSTEKRFAP